jgi:hypothetical protein
VAIDAILSQDEKPISYFSEKLNDVKKKYSSYDKELYAIIKDYKKWRHYFVPKVFILYTDNHVLQFITRKEKMN